MDVDELTAALQKLGFTNFLATEVFEVVKEEQHKAQVERARHSCVVSQFHYKNMISLKMFIAVASQPGEMQIEGIPPYTSTVVKYPVPHSASTRSSAAAGCVLS